MEFRGLRLSLAACGQKKTGGLAAVLALSAAMFECKATRGLSYRRRRFCTQGSPLHTTPPSLGYVDAHCHLTHHAFKGPAGQDAVVDRCRAAGLQRIIVNGMEPRSNRQVLSLCERHPDILRPALGIYPTDACAPEIDAEEYTEKLSRKPPAVFCIADEIAFIEEKASQGLLSAVGEVGLDGMEGYSEKLLGAQEAVLRELCRVAKRHKLPLILHSRKAEARTFAVLQDEGVELADFHCYMGKRQLGVKIAEAGYFLSIPTLVARNEQLQSLCKALPAERILTETDAPYMSPERGSFPNDPSSVPKGVAAIAEARGTTEVAMREQIRTNYATLFGD